MLLKIGPWQKPAAEAIGTFTIVLAGCGSLAIADRFPGSVSRMEAPLVFGVAVAVMIYSLGHISGAHFNPAVSLAFGVTGRLPLRHVWTYWAGQFSGAALAIAAIHLLLPAGDVYGAAVPAVTGPYAFAWEALLTFVLMFVITAVATDSRAVGAMAGITIGATVMLGALVGGSVTGASMNPARGLAPAVAEGRFEQLWAYLLGPLLGAPFAALAYECIRCETKQDPTGRDENSRGCC